MAAKGKLVISVRKPTPLWAKWVFRTFYAISTVAAVWLYATRLLAPTTKFEILLAFCAVDRGVWIIAKGLGIKKESMNPDAKRKANDY